MGMTNCFVAYIGLVDRRLIGLAKCRRPSFSCCHCSPTALLSTSCLYFIPNMLINVPKTGVWCEQFPAPGLLATNRVKPAVVPVVESLPWEMRDLTEIYLIKNGWGITQYMHRQPERSNQYTNRTNGVQEARQKGPCQVRTIVNHIPGLRLSIRL